MKRTLTRKTAYALLGGALLLGAGCAKEASLNEQYRPAGTPIVFSTATSYKNGDGTRTEYSGQLYGEPTEYERIDWLAEDEMTIAYVHAGETSSADYVVTSATGSSQTSTASVEAVSASSKLTWGAGAGNHVFYGMYPANGFNGNNTASLTNSHHVEGAIPSASQEFHVEDGRYLPPMQYAYMVSCKEIDGDSHESRVTLPFTPAVTAFQFRLQRRTGDPDAKITGVELTATTPLTGTFAFDITGGDENGAIWNKLTTGSNPTVLSDPGYTLTYTFPVTGGVNIPASGGTDFLDFTLLALPVEQTGLRLKLIYANGTTKTLDLSDGVFQAAKKTIITNRQVPGGSWEYHISNLSAVTVAYTGGTGTLGSGFVSYKTDGSSSQAVPFVLEYSENGTSGWSTTKPAWITPSGNFNGSTTGQTLTASIAASPRTTYHHTVLAARSPKSNFDLSTKNVATGATVSMTTANCYVVDAPGTYKFPLVYGNAIQGGNAVSNAYSGFMDHTDNTISSAYIGVQHSNKSLTASVLWSDVDNLVTNAAISGSGSGAYLTFTVSKDYIDQGNAVIAVKANNDIAWSWHIWVTDDNLTATQSNNWFNFAPVNIGWRDGLWTTYYAERTCYVRAVQTETGGQPSNAILVKETVYNPQTNTAGSSPFYQWGRKDPLVPGKFTNNNSNASLGTAIKNPAVKYNNGNSGDWCSSRYANLWNKNQSSHGGAHSLGVSKTIYDPSPTGYKVPPQSAFDNMRPSWTTIVHSGNKGWKFNSCLFPALGQLTTGVVDSGNRSCYWNASSYQATVGDCCKLVNNGSGNLAFPGDWLQDYKALGQCIKAIRE